MILLMRPEDCDRKTKKKQKKANKAMVSRGGARDVDKSSSIRSGSAATHSLFSILRLYIHATYVHIPIDHPKYTYLKVG